MKISVIIPAFNRVKTLARAIDSVLAQSYKVSEIIVVDDGSSDATSEVAKNYPEVLLLRQNNLGVSTARNNGVMMASYEWVAFLDSDDTWHPKKLAFQIAHHKKNLSSLVSYTDEVWIRNDKPWPVPKKFRKPEQLSFENSLDFCNIAPSSVLINKEYFERVGGFDERFEVCEDYDLWLRILKEDSIDLIPQALINKYGGADDQLSMKFKFLDRWHILALFKHLDKEGVKEKILFMCEGLQKAALKHKDEKLLDECAVWKLRLSEEI
ncbi:glycosyltransferase [Sulfurimonas sp. MAG313]|nr:glycosyltransferase [Sulfurimonas sp. MAG313]MDF1880941.1 glycosyltransferase [Sulfurimonas sp. MAG313]